MHWEALTFYIEPRELIFGEVAIIGAVTVEIGDCDVAVKDLKLVRASIKDLAKAVGRDIALHTAYPSEYLDVATYFLGRYGIPRLSLRVVNADPREVPFRAFNDEGLLRNIAYLHGVKHVVLSNNIHLNSRKTSYTVHKILMESGYNADKNLAKRHRGSLPCRVRLA
ncbi:hypothetical protein VMUT_0995 [Vulcanisaeta moutnovskia 768-28]|uniref:Uncharacterized protein n=1 Tax=Vulcanisaeta moutnovskia (strain 768-28) TaxID=985053 RepID=F0QXG4_VULM7|nr:hypothetical protein [Vulcanisaeta moutnovskia]ADY01203.1 hypothetical protein VMUT_0995 [Vulcanisaeta moutnovskia 768-28]